MPFDCCSNRDEKRYADRFTVVAIHTRNNYPTAALYKLTITVLSGLTKGWMN